MAYLALYRRYRPDSFDKLIGQNHIVKILKNQIREDRVGHAYLFCGARGTGKTSAAKIFARAINCEHPADGSPCGKCAACAALAESNNMDILEIDAASNNRVDEVRDIREKVQYPPVSGRYKVYIIDEVHMLTDSAFNALLKTLEEPPSHAVFILATTEPQKLPATILSRCMRFDFRLISETEIASLIEGIFREIRLDYEPEAVRLIARSGEGSVRDALSLADKCVSFGEGRLKYQDVLEVLGGADHGKIVALGKDILAGDAGGVLTRIDELVGLGKSIAVLAKDLAGFFRDASIVKSVQGANGILNLPEEKFAELAEIGRDEDVARMLRCLELFAGLEAELRHSLNPRILLETTALKCARATNDMSVDGLLRRVNTLEKQVAQLSKGVPPGSGPPARPAQAARPAAPAGQAPPQSAQMSEQPVPAQPQPAQAQSQQPTVQAQQQQPRQAQAKPGQAAAAAPPEKAPSDKVWPELLKAVRKGANRLLFNIVQSAEAEVNGNTLTILSSDENAAAYLKKPEILAQYKAVLEGLGYRMEVVSRITESTEEDTFHEDLQRTKEVLGTENIKVK